MNLKWSRLTILIIAGVTILTAATLVFGADDDTSKAQLPSGVRREEAGTVKKNSVASNGGIQTEGLNEYKTIKEQLVAVKLGGIATTVKPATINQAKGVKEQVPQWESQQWQNQLNELNKVKQAKSQQVAGPSPQQTSKETQAKAKKGKGKKGKKKK